MNDSSGANNSSVYPEFLSGGGEMGERIRNFNWAATPLGVPAQWPQSLKTCVRIMLTSPQPMFVWWGEETLVNIYNDAYRFVLGGKHPQALGVSGKSAWKEIWDDVWPRAEVVFTKNEGTFDDALLLIMNRNGFEEETYFQFSYNPIPGDQGGTAGLFCVCSEETEKIITERSLSTLQLLGSITQRANLQELFEGAAKVFEANTKDFPCAIIYKIDAENKEAAAIAFSGISGDHPELPISIQFGSENTIGKNLAQCISENKPVLSETHGRWTQLPTGGWAIPPAQFIHVPIKTSNKKIPLAVLSLALNPYRNYDERYQNFVQLIADQVSLEANNVLAIELEREKTQLLEKSDARLRNLVQQAPVAMCVLRGPNHIVEVANERALELWGKSEAQMLNKPVFEGMPDAAGQGLEALLDGVYNTGKRFVANEMVVNLFRNGKFDTTYLNFVYEALHETDGTISGVVAVATEVTEQVNARKNIEATAALLSIALEAGELGTYDYYPQTGELVWSDKTKEFFGLPANAVVNFDMYLNIVHPEDRERTRSALAEAMDAKNGGSYENDYRTVGVTDGRIRWVKTKGKINFDMDGTPVRFTGVTQDITRQKEILVSLQLQSLVLEKMDEGVSVSDANGIIILTNAAEDKMFGYEPGELTGKHVSTQNAYEPLENEQIVGKVFGELKQKGFWNGQWHNRKKDGTTFYTFSFITEIQIDQEPFYVCVQRDITEELMAREKLAFRTALLEAQNEAIPDALLTVDAKGKILSFNQHFITLWNIPKDIIERKDDAAALRFAMTQLEDPVGFIDSVNQYYSNPHERSHEEIQFKDGRIIERYGNAVNGEDGINYGWAWYFRDITARKKIEADLKNAKEQLELTFKNIPAGVYLFNKEGELVYVNDKGAKVYGNYTAENLLAEKDLPALLKKAEELFERYDEKGNLFGPKGSPAYISLATGKASQATLHQVDRVTKKEQWSYVQGAPLFDDNGEVSMVLVTSTDITDQKNAEMKIRQSEEKISTFILQAPIAMGLYRGPQLVVEIVNKELLDFWGKSYDDVIGKPVFTAVPEAQGQGYEAILEKVYDTGISYEAFGSPVILPRNGNLQTLYVNIVYQAYREPDGTISGVVEVVTDVTQQVTAVERIKVSEQRFGAAVAAVKGNVWTNTARGEMEGEQPGWTALTGQTYEQYRGYGWASAVHPDDAQATVNAWNEAVKNKSIFSFEHRLLLKNGEWGQFAVRAIPLLNEDLSIREWVGVHTDITEQRQTETDLKKIKAQLELTFRNVPAAIYLYGKSGELLFCNQTGATLMGYETVEELLAEKDYARLVKKSADTFEVLNEQRKPLPLDGWPSALAFKSGKSVEAISLFVRLSDSKETWILTRSSPLLNASGELEMVLTTSTDITAQKTAEQAIRQSEEKFRTLAETLPQMVWMRSTSGVMEYASNSWETYSGIKNISEAWKVMPHPDDREAIMAVWQKAQDMGKPFTYEVRLKNKEGDYRWHYAVGEPVRDELGNVTKWIGALTDIHIQKTFAENLEKLVAERTTELERSNEDLQQFAHVASHDLKEPVRKILTFGNRLKEEFYQDLPERAKTYVSKIESASKRMYSMIDGVLLYSSANPLHATKEPIDLNDLITNIETDLEVMVTQKSARIFMQHKLPIINGYPVLIYQLFYNLVNNALKFSKDKVDTVIEISSVAADGKETSAHALHENQHYVKIILKDNGIGFTAEDAAKIFVAFTRLYPKDKYEGTGLGLALCKKIVERHGGAIWAEGKEGEGATFNILLPV